MPFPQLLEHTGTILGFVWSEMLCSSEIISISAAASLHSSPVNLTDRLVECLIELIPKVESELNQFQDLVQQPCIDFEHRLTTYGLLPLTSSDLSVLINPTNNPTSKNPNTNTTASKKEPSKSQSAVDNSSSATSTSIMLTEVVSSLKIRYAKSRRRELLVRAREVLLADYHNTMLASGDALEVCIYVCSISIIILMIKLDLVLRYIIQTKWF